MKIKFIIFLLNFKDKFRFKALDVSDLVSLLHELSLFDGRIDRIYVKDNIDQEFIDRIGKLYKPVLMKQVGIMNGTLQS